jgi:hypothetical protein
VDDGLQAQRAQLLLLCVAALNDQPTIVAHWLACAGSEMAMLMLIMFGHQYHQRVQQRARAQVVKHVLNGHEDGATGRTQCQLLKSAAQAGNMPCHKALASTLSLLL